jgi:hypothetical protein
VEKCADKFFENEELLDLSKPSFKDIAIRKVCINKVFNAWHLPINNIKSAYTDKVK